MTSPNTVTLVGKLVKDAKENIISEKLTKYDFTLAINRSRKNGDEWIDEVSYIDVVIFNKDWVKQYLTKGNKVYVQGYLKQDRWEKDGNKCQKLYVVCTEFMNCSNSKSNANNSTTEATKKTFTPIDQPQNDYIPGGEDIPF